MKRNRALIGTIAASAVAAATLAGGAPAQAGSVNDDPPVATGLGGPLQLTFDTKDRPVFSQSFGPGTVSRVNRNGNVVNIVQDFSGSISGVALRGDRIAYTLAEGAGPMRAAKRPSARAFARALRGEVGTSQFLKLQAANGQQRVLADLGRAEANRNPDGHQVYGWVDYRERCGEAAPNQHAPRAGIRESNPHAVAAAPGGGWYVADAAANTIWKVKKGAISVVSVLKPRVLTVTAEQAEAWGGDCDVTGTRYFFEPVPTDIEVDDKGRLIVSLLPGEGNFDESEDPEANTPPPGSAPGAVVRINPKTGRATTIASGFIGAANLAMAPQHIYVAEIFGNRVSRINNKTGAVRPVAGLSTPSTVGFHKGTLWTTYDMFDFEEPPGASLATIDRSGPFTPYEPPPPPLND